MAYYSTAFIESFWARTRTEPGGCVVWTRSRTRDGYGNVGYQGIVLRCHRVSWELAHGQPVPRGWSVLHSCDNPPCVNPAHLRLGTQADNVHDMAQKGRSRTGDRRGERNTAAKLTVPQVLAIRSRYAAGNTTYAALGREYEVSWSMIRMIVKGLKWRELVEA